jgi:hypothetical protein
MSRTRRRFILCRQARPPRLGATSCVGSRIHTLRLPPQMQGSRSAPLSQGGKARAARLSCRAIADNKGSIPVCASIPGRAVHRWGGGGGISVGGSDLVGGRIPVGDSNLAGGKMPVGAASIPVGAGYRWVTGHRWGSGCRRGQFHRSGELYIYTCGGMIPAGG